MIRVALAVFLLFALILVGWLGYVSTLTAEEDRACGSRSGTDAAGARDDSGQIGQAIQAVLDSYSKKRDGVGLQATVILPNGVVWSGVSGYASHEKACPLSIDHHLYVGSVTKLFTAAMVMDQVERGAIALDDTLDRWLELPYADAVTIRMLLNHTSGIPNYTEDLWFLARYFGLPRKAWRPDELVAVIGNRELDFEPGSRHTYSNSNYLFLGVVLEAVTGRSYGAFLKGFTDELGLKDTYYATRPSGLLIANGYDESLLNLGRRNLTGFRRSLETGAFSAGGVLSTSRDVALFLHRLFAGEVVDEATLGQMKALVEAPDEDVPLQTGYGLGIRNLVVDGQSLLGHTGTIPGYSGIVMHHEDLHYTIAILSNLSLIDQAQLFSSVQDALLNEVAKSNGKTAR